MKEMEKKLLDQLEIWHQNDQYEEIVNMLNSIPKVNWDEEHYQRMASAKNNLSQYEEAIELLVEIEDTCTEKHRWYFKLGYAYFYLDQIEKAYDAFEEALKYDENDEGTLSFIDECIRYLVVPIKDSPFSLRVEECWKTFVEKENGLRELIARKEDSHKILSYCEDIMNVAFKSSYFELGFNGEKFDLILSSEGDPVLMFKLVYFKSQAPQSVFENWNIIIGRQRSNDQYEFQMYNKRITMSDVSVFVENKEDSQYGITIYHKDIAALLKEDEDKAYSLVSVLLDQAIGEIPAMKYIAYLDILEKSLENETVRLNDLNNYLQQQVTKEQLEAWDEPESICERYTVYELESQDSDEARSDIFVGSTCCPRIVNAYLSDNSYYEEMFDEDGANIGFVFYSLEGIENVLDYRDEIIEELEKTNNFVFIGGATGTQYGYIDFISWNLYKTINAIKEAFKNKSSLEVCYQRYRRDLGWVYLKNEKETVVN